MPTSIVHLHWPLRLDTVHPFLVELHQCRALSAIGMSSLINGSIADAVRNGAGRTAIYAFVGSSVIERGSRSGAKVQSLTMNRI